MLHGVNKNDKKAKQQVSEQIKKMEEDLKKQHEKELKDIELNAPKEPQATEVTEVPKYLL